jgi:hypothetical protein
MKTPRPAAPAYVSCDANIEVKASTTTCALAQNTFYEYWYSWNYLELDAFAAYSAAADEWLDMTCRGEERIACEAVDGSVVRFPMSAVLAYNEEAAARYAAKATVSATPDDAGGERTPEPDYDDGAGEAYDDVPYDRDCADFAESDFPTPPGDPDGLDGDGDGIACES